MGRIGISVNNYTGLVAAIRSRLWWVKEQEKTAEKAKQETTIISLVRSGGRAKPTVLEIASSRPSVHARERSGRAWDSDRGARSHSRPSSRSA